MLHHLLGDRLHDLVVDVEQVVAAHARLAGHAGCDDHDVRVGALCVVAGADHTRVRTPHRTRFEHVERDAFRLLVGDVDDNDVGELLVGHAPSHGGADIPAPPTTVTLRFISL